MSCPEDPGRPSEGLSRGERLQRLEHIRRCSRCAAELAVADPSRLFALLALDAPPVEELDRLSTRIDAEIDAEPRRTSSVASWMSMAASLLLAGVFATYLGTQPTVLPQTAGLRRSTLESLDLHAIPTAPSAGTVEWVSSPGTAQVMDLSVGEMQVVMIFDEAMDI